MKLEEKEKLVKSSFVDIFSTAFFRFGQNMSKDDMPVSLQDGKHTLRIHFFQGLVTNLLSCMFLIYSHFLLIWVHPNFHSFDSCELWVGGNAS
jgi:hypothetical protein